MCGFCFIYKPGSPPEEIKQSVEKSLKALRHRGPDDSGLWLDPPVGLGHQRLSIIDLGGSRQPMSDNSNRFVLIYNGEIYNYKELRQNLEKKWNFQSAGDTEVLLAGLVLYGPDFCKKMEGMWAFALWDNQKKSLLLGRDRMGKKPLYYQAIPGGFACASELPALKCLTPSWEEDLGSTADYFRYGFYLPGTTAYKYVFEILPGHTAYWKPLSYSGVEQEPYWSLELKSFSGTKQQAKEQLKDLFIQAIQKRLVADVEVGAFLSGGIDSSLIVSVMTKDLLKRPKTFTVGFEENSYDERSFARILAEYLETEHYEELQSILTPSSFERLLIENIGQPFADASLLPTSLLARLSSRYVKVALSGDGADELFSGYQRYQARVLFRWYSRLPQSCRKSIEGLIRAFPEPMVSHSRSLLKKAHLFCQAANRLADEKSYIAPTYFTNEQFAQLAPELADKGHEPPGIKQMTELDDLKSMMATDALVYLPQDILVKVDRATMAYSLEARAPFLDTKLVELVFSFPSHWHRYGLKGKRMLRETFSQKIPKTIWKRRKQGFAVPINIWFQGKLGDSLYDLLQNTTVPINKVEVMRLLTEHRRGRMDFAFQLWIVYVYLIWGINQKKHQLEG